VSRTEYPWVGEVLGFWFEELGATRWFPRDDAVDERIRVRFLALHERLVSNDGCDVDTPESILAAVIVVDQFSRNMFRGTSRAFAADPLALRLARRAIAQRFDAAMTIEARLFLYLPFEHSEDPADQALAVDLMRGLGHDDWTRYAESHKAIIDRFGRFPHRNIALGRLSTADELAFLVQPGSSF
jgi:uncharacterized protein (DUF924 family)